MWELQSICKKTILVFFALNERNIPQCVFVTKQHWQNGSKPSNSKQAHKPPQHSVNLLELGACVVHCSSKWPLHVCKVQVNPEFWDVWKRFRAAILWESKRHHSSLQIPVGENRIDSCHCSSGRTSGQWILLLGSVWNSHFPEEERFRAKFILITCNRCCQSRVGDNRGYFRWNSLTFWLVAFLACEPTHEYRIVIRDAERVIIQVLLWNVPCVGNGTSAEASRLGIL